VLRKGYFLGIGMLMVLEGENWGEEKEVEVSDEVLGISFD
jgi:hypothetical protein